MCPFRYDFLWLLFSLASTSLGIILTLNKVLLKKELHDLINAGMTLSKASKYLAKKNNLKKSTIYDLH